MSIKSLYIIKRETGVCMYHKDFADSIFDPHLLSSFIVAMTTFFDEATGAIESRARAFEGSDYKLIVEFGAWTLGVLSVIEDSGVMRERLRRTLVRFEDQFNLLRWVDLDLAIYSRFERIVIEEFIRDQVQPESVIQVKRDWEYLTKNPDVISFLRLIPKVCTVRNAAEFLEMPIELVMNLVADALWEKVVIISQPVKPDDIYQPTDVVAAPRHVPGVSSETTRALAELDGETPLSIAAERVRTKDLKRFLEEIAVLARRRAIEQISPAQSMIVLYSFALQAILNSCADLFGVRLTRKLFFKAKAPVVTNHSWITYVSLEEGVDVEIKPSLTSATVKGDIAPDILVAGFGDLCREISVRMKDIIGSVPLRTIIEAAKDELENQFPTRAFHVEWERLMV